MYAYQCMLALETAYMHGGGQGAAGPARLADLLSGLRQVRAHSDACAWFDSGSCWQVALREVRRASLACIFSNAIVLQGAMFHAALVNVQDYTIS
jgi:hypothetical protein